jgi:hypothetical protein
VAVQADVRVTSLGLCNAAAALIFFLCREKEFLLFLLTTFPACGLWLLAILTSKVRLSAAFQDFTLHARQEIQDHFFSVTVFAPEAAATSIACTFAFLAYDRRKISTLGPRARANVDRIVCFLARGI